MIMIQKIFLTLLGSILIMSIWIQAESITNTEEITKVPTQYFLRFIDTKEKFGKSCAEYYYITPNQKQKLLKNSNIIAGDILNDSLPISKNNHNPIITEQKPNLNSYVSEDKIDYVNLLKDSFALSRVNPDDIIETNLTSCDTQDNYYIGTSLYKEKVIYLTENIITIKVYQDQHGIGAAHGNRNITYTVYDREYGMRLDWESLFGKYGEFDKYIIQRVMKEIANLSFLESFNSKKAVSNFRLPGRFAIIDEGLLIRYRKYEINAGAAGLPFIIITKEILKQYMTPKMYEMCFASKNTILKEPEDEYTN